MRVGINGMGRIGRLALRAAFGAAERPSDDPRAGNRLEVVHLNELKGGAAAIPCGFGTERRLPIGLQIIGNYFNEGQLLAIADVYQNVTDWHQRKPEQQ